MNKKLVYWNIFLILALFLVSSCSKGEIGKGLDIQSKDYTLKVGQSVIFNNVEIKLIDVGPTGDIIVNEQVIGPKEISTVTKMINPSFIASVDLTNLKTYYTQRKETRQATIRINRNPSVLTDGNKYELKIGESGAGLILKDIELIDVGPTCDIIISVNNYQLLDGSAVKIRNIQSIRKEETKIIRNIVIKSVECEYNTIKEQRKATLEVKQL